MPLTAGQLVAHLQGYDADTPVVVDTYTGDGRYLRVENITITSAQGRGPDGVELEIFWEPAARASQPRIHGQVLLVAAIDLSVTAGGRQGLLARCQPGTTSPAWTARIARSRVSCFSPTGAT
jgi:hypothetical protein